jgi:hypothetical protein
MGKGLDHVPLATVDLKVSPVKSVKYGEGVSSWAAGGAAEVVVSREPKTNGIRLKRRIFWMLPLGWRVVKISGMQNEMSCGIRGKVETLSETNSLPFQLEDRFEKDIDNFGVVDGLKRSVFLPSSLALVFSFLWYVVEFVNPLI